MNIALIGFGHVGRAFFNLLGERKNELEAEGIFLNIKYVLRNGKGAVNTKGSLRAQNETIRDDELRWDREIDFTSIMNAGDVDFLVEVTPTNIKDGEPASAYIREALRRGISVVSGNKGPALLYYGALSELAQKNGVSFDIGCTLGGALPVMDMLRFGLAGARVEKIEGVWNGTSNFILTEMSGGVSYEQALCRAVEAGIAETNPEADVSGLDTALKTLIAANCAFGTEKKISDVNIQGILRSGELRPNSNMNSVVPARKTKLIGRAVRLPGDGIEVTVGCEELTSEHPLYHVDATNKGVILTTDSLGKIVVSGGASSPKAAAAALLRDIVNRLRVRNMPRKF